jgi:tetratricopeptide (TPR) repeat protein
MFTESTWLEELRKGLDSSSKGGFDDALACFERARALAPDRPETACALGRERMRRGDFEAARELLQSAWEAGHSLVTAGTSLARCVGLYLGDFEEAHQVLDQVDEHKGVQPATRIVRAELLLEDGRHEEAAILTESLLPARPQSAPPKSVARSATLLMSRVENERGLCAVAQGGYERAIFAFKRAGDLDPLWAAPQSNLGASFEQLGRLRRAEKSYRQACTLDPNYARAWHNLGKLYQKQSDPRSLDCLARGYMADPARLELAVDYAAALRRIDAPDQAREVLHDHAEELGDLGEAWANLALPLVERGALDLAEMCVQKAQERCSDDTLRSRLHAILDSQAQWPSKRA